MADGKKRKHEKEERDASGSNHVALRISYRLYPLLAAVAQLVERWPEEPSVGGSTPPGGTNKLWRYAGAWLIGPVLKTVGEKSHEGSNPSTSSKCICSLIGRVRCYERRSDIGSTPIRCTNKCGYNTTG